MKALQGRMPLAPYYPAFVILVGAVLVAIGGFWAAARQANFNARLNAKNNEIIALQDQQIKAVTGGDSYPFVMPVLKGDGKLTMWLRNDGKYPLYGIQANILDHDLFGQLIEKSDNKPEDILSLYNQSQHVIIIGDLGPGQYSEIANFDLDPRVGARDFTMYLLARNGRVNEQMRLRWVKDHWSFALKASNQKGVLQENVATDYPSDQLWK